MERLTHDQTVLRWIAVLGGVLAILVSFPQLRWVYEDYIGMPTWAAYLVPLMIDLLAVMFAGVVGTTVGAPPRARLYSWAGLGVFVAVSVAGNAMHAWWHRTGDYLPSTLTANEGWVLLVFAAMPPIGAALGIHGRSFLDRIGVDADRAATPAPAARTQPAAPAARTARTEPARTQLAAHTEPAPTEPARTAPATPITRTTPRAAWQAAAAHLHAHTTDRERGWKKDIYKQLVDDGVDVPHRSSVDRWLEKLEAANPTPRGDDSGERAVA